MSKQKLCVPQTIFFELIYTERYFCETLCVCVLDYLNNWVKLWQNRGVRRNKITTEWTDSSADIVNLY